MPSMSPQVSRSATSIYSGIVAAVTTIAVSIILYRKLWETRNKSRNPKQGHPNTSQPQFIDQEVPSITLTQGSSSFKIDATVILNGDGQFTKIQRKLICDCIVNLPDINNNLKKHGLVGTPHVQTQSITTLPHAEAGFKDYRNKKKSGPCLKGTRVALLREMADCVTGSSESRMYVLSGLAGIGKSTVACTIASRAADLNLLGASFFFSRDEADSNNAKRFFTTIAHQLCVYDEAFSKAIGGVLETTSESLTTTQNPQLQLKLFIMDPLRSILQSRSRPILIVVDALDECDEEDAFSVLTGLIQLVRDLPPFKVILTTRPQPCFDRFWHSQDGHRFFHLQDMEDKVVDSDIRLYLDCHFSVKQVQDSFPMWGWCASDEEIDSLVCAAGRLFIIASTAVRYILDKTASNPAAQMQKLLRASNQDHTPFNDLDCFYTVILRDAVPEDCDDDDIVNRYQSVIGMIIFAQHTLPVSTLVRLIGTDVEEIHTVLDKLQSVILLGDDDVPRIYHKSFPEYLTDQSRCKDPHLRIDPRIRHTQIATHCFEIMDKHLKYNILGLSDPARFMSNEDGLKEDRITDEQLEEKIPQQLRYACIYWANHLEAANAEDADLVNELEKFLTKHILHWFEVLSLVGNLDSAYLAIRVVLKLSKLSSDLHHLLFDAINFIGKLYEIIKRSTLHTYYSALSLTPTDSLLYRQYNREAAHNICVIEDGPRWDPIIADLRHGEGVDVVKFSLDSTLLASCTDENVSDISYLSKQGQLKIWDGATGTPISTIPGDKFAVANDFSAVASSRDNIVMLYNVNGSPIGTIFTTSSKIKKLALSSESGRIAAALADGAVWLWESRNAELIDRFDGFSDNADRPLLEFSPTGTRLAYSSANSIKLRDGTSGRFIADLRCGSNHRFKFSGDGSRIAALSKRCCLTLWDSESGGLVDAIMDVSDGQYSRMGFVHGTLAISANGSLLATAPANGHENVTLWSENRHSLAHVKVLDFDSPRSMALSLDNILAIATNSEIQLYNVKTHSFIHTLLLSGIPFVQALAFSPDCTRLAIGYHDGDVILYDIRGIDASGPPSKGNTTTVTALTLSPDCLRLACGFADGTVELWETSPTKRQVASHKAYENRVQALGFSPDGGLFASSSVSLSQPIKLWNGKDGLLYGTPQEPPPSYSMAAVIVVSMTEKVEAVVLSNSVLVAARHDGVTLWSLDTLNLIHTFTESSYEMPTLVSISENNALIAVVHRRGVSLLDAENYRTITTFDVLDGIHMMTFLPDNSQLVALSKDGVFLSFNLLNKHIMKGATLENLIQLPSISLWHGVPVWYDNDHHYLTALFPQHKNPAPVFWIPGHIPVTIWTQGPSMIALGCKHGRVILLRLPTSHAS